MPTQWKLPPSNFLFVSVTEWTGVPKIGRSCSSSRSIQAAGPPSLRRNADTLFTDALKPLKESDFSKLHTIPVHFALNPVTVFVKENPDTIQWPTDFCTQSEYKSQFYQELTKSITAYCISQTGLIKHGLVKRGLVERGLRVGSCGHLFFFRFFPPFVNQIRLNGEQTFTKTNLCLTILFIYF